MYFTYEGGAPLSVPPKRALANVEARIRRVEADSIEDTINAHDITTLMSPALSDKARQTGARLKAEREAAKAEEVARVLKLEVEGKTERPEVTRHRQHVESQRHIGDFVTELLKTRGK
jgi:hypothetical protein